MKKNVLVFSFFVLCFCVFGLLILLLLFLDVIHKNMYNEIFVL